MQLQRVFLISALALSLWCTDPLLSAPAHAGPVEELIQVATHPSDANVMVLRYEYGGDGMFITHDGGMTWSLLCSKAISPALTRGGPIAVAADGRIFMGVFQGLWADDGAGCGWALEGAFTETWVRDLVAHPSDPNVLFAVTSKGGEGEQNGVYQYTGGAWTPLGAQAEMLISRIHVAETDEGLRFYQSAQTLTPLEDGSPNYVIRVSDDDGANWTDHPFGPTDGQLRLEGVDPSNPDRLIASLTREEQPDTLVVSSDAGMTWTDYATVSRFGGLAFAPDGRVWFGDGGDNSDLEAPKGLWGAANLDTSPMQLNDEISVKCVTYRSDEALFVCERFDAGRFDLAMNSLVETFSFTEVESFVSCPGVDMLETCRDQLLTAYCGITHFPFAPVCGPYGVDTSSLGDSGCAFDFDAGVGTGTSADGGCLMPGDDPPAGEPPTTAGTGAGMSGGASGTGASGSSGGPRVADAGVAGGGEDGGGDDGGGCSAAGTGARGGLWALGALLALWVRRRR